MSDPEIKKEKSILYGDYQINILDNEGKMVIEIKKGNCNFLLKSRMEYSEKFNFMVESDSCHNTVTISFYDKREKTPLFRLPTNFINKIVKKVKIPIIEDIKIECSIIFGSVAGFVAVCISVKKQEKTKEIYVKNPLEDINKSQRMYNFASFSSGTARMNFEMEKSFISHLVRNTKMELGKQVNQLKNRTDYFQI